MEAMSEERWRQIWDEFEAVHAKIDALAEKLREEQGEDRKEEYLASNQLFRASEHILDAQEHWRKVDVNRK